MDNNKINDFMNAVGLMTELWMLSFNYFKKLGLTEKQALEHTKAFMAMTYELTDSTGGKNKQNDKA